MIKNRQLKSTYLKFVFSFSFLAIILTVSLTATTYYYFSMNYKQELEHVHKQMLEYTSNIIYNEAIEETQKIYLQLVSTPSNSIRFDYFLQQPIKGNHYKVSQLQDELQRLVAVHSDLINAIHVYYNKKELLISSSIGIKEDTFSNRKFFSSLRWKAYIYDNNALSGWLPTETYYASKAIPAEDFTPRGLTYVRTYPYAKRGSDADCIIAIDIKESYFHHIIEESLPTHFQDTYMITKDWQVISASDKSLIQNPLAYHYQLNIDLNALTDYTSRILDEDSIVTFVPVPHTSFFIVNKTTLSNFYNKSKDIQLVILILGCICLLLGFFIAIGLSYRLYWPLKKTIMKIKSQSKDSLIKSNEFDLIHDFMDTLNNRILELNDTLKESQPILKHILVSDLINNIISQQDLEDRLNLLNIAMHKKHYACIIVNFQFTPQWSKLELDQKQMIKYAIIQSLEDLDNETYTTLSAELSDAKLAVIVGLTEDDYPTLENISFNILKLIESNVLMNPIIAFGSIRENLIDLHHSFKEATKIMDYHYFMPDQYILSWEKLSEREMSVLQIEEDIHTLFTETLYKRNLASIGAYLEHLIHYFQRNLLSADYCNRVLLDLLRYTSKYASDINYNKKDSKDYEQIYTSFNTINDIYNFKKWLLNYIQHLFAYINNKEDTKNADLVKRVKIYMEENYYKDIGLDLIADMEGITPRYLSKLFKEETGINYSTYLTNIRMERSKDLLINSTLNIDEIASNVGYRTSSYFIQVFKKTNGYTPKNYRMQFMQQ